MADRFPLPPLDTIRQQVEQALAEDVGSGDLTAELVPEDATDTATIVAREAGVLCGSDWVNEVFSQVDPAIRLNWKATDGETLGPEQVVCELSGKSRSLLTGERAALNFLQTLSGTASTVATYVNAVAGMDVRILDTRKTIPGLRLAQKYAVLCGGGANHRIGLYDAILIKENHIQAAGSIAAVMQRTKKYQVEVEIEVESLEELQQALDAGAQRVLLDNFTIAMLEQAVTLNAGRARLEVSGNVTLDTLPAIAATGIDDISIGTLTKHLHALDLSMRFASNA